MKTLLLLRHAKSSWDDPALDDHDRPLNQRGYLEAPRIGAFLKQKELLPDRVISSTARRARDTAELVIRTSGCQADLKLEAGLYGADSTVFQQLLKNLPEKDVCVLLVGHNPDIEEFIYELTRERAAIATATLARIKLPIDHWQEIEKISRHGKKAELAGVWQAKHLAAG